MHSYPIPGTKQTLHHADLYRLETMGDVDELALHELAEFGGIVLIEWGDVAAAAIGDHLEVRLERDETGESDEIDESEATGEIDESDETEATGETGEIDEFGLDETRLVTLEPSGPGWSGRWDRVVRAMEPYRC